MNQTTVIFKIVGMHCVSCAINIDFELEELKGVKKVNTNYARQQSIVTYDPKKVSPEQMLPIIYNLGYEAIIQR